MANSDFTNQEINVAFIGFGEAAQAFVKGWSGVRPHDISAYDIKTDHHDNSVASAKWQDYERYGVTGFASSSETLAAAQVVFSVVTADQALPAAKEAAKHLPPDTFFFDCNSCAPSTKKQAAATIEAANGRYIDVAVMAPVSVRLHKTPLLISGAHAQESLASLSMLQMNAEYAGADIGAASTVKMVRSVMMKGLEALVLECVLAGRKAGVDDKVLQSLDLTYPGFDFKTRSTYMMERAMVHGIRRAAEMREVVKTLEDLGFGANMTKATVDWEQKIGELQLKAGDGDYTLLADTMLQALFKKEDVA